MTYNKKCPICRKIINYRDIHTVTRIVTMCSRIAKLNILLKISKLKNRKVVVYVKNYKEGQYLSNFLFKKKMSNVLCCGRKIETKNKLISNVNKNKCFTVVIIDKNSYLISKSLIDIQDIYFLNTTTLNKLENYCCKSYINGDFKNINIFFLRQIVKSQ